VIVGLAIGSGGGAIFAYLGFPAPWLAGSMIAAVIAVFLGIKLGMPEWLKAAAFILLGIQTGTSVNWDTLQRAAQWPISIAFLVLTVVTVTWVCYVYYLRRKKWDAPTAFFARPCGRIVAGIV
jgi:uncharacterized protein